MTPYQRHVKNKSGVTRAVGAAAAVLGCVLIGAVLLIGYRATSGPADPVSTVTPAEHADEVRYSELIDRTNDLRAEGWAETSQYVADARVDEARALRVFSEKYGRRPKYITKGQR